jgi:cell wall-associated NlpC family hydrolase
MRDIIKSDDLIGKPFKYGGRGPDEFDCWGLYRFSYHRWRKVWLPDHPSQENVATNGVTITEEAVAHWQRIYKPEPGSAILLRVKHRILPTHIGFMLTDDRFLHTMEQNNGVSIERASDPVWTSRTIGFFRHNG